MLNFFSLVDNPFSVSPSPRYFYVSPVHKGILAKIEYVVTHRQGLTVLYGDIGLGKTSMARFLVDRLSDSNLVIFLTNPNFKSEMHMTKAICAEFGLPPRRSLYSQMESIQAHLTDLYSKDQSPILIIDEAQLMVGKQYEILRQITNFETNDTKLIQLVLCGQLELRNKLRLKKALMSRVVISSTLEPLSPDEMGEMLLFRVTVAGGNGDLFNSAALEKVYEISRGVPRHAVKVCGVAMKLAHINQQRQLTPEIIEAAAREVGS